MALAAIVVGFVVYMDSNLKPPHDLGEDLFHVISILAYIYCLLTGVRSTADCLSEEKREGTLGLLFLTDLKGYDVVGGKLVATSLNAFYGLIAIFPVLAVPLLMGGITNGEFWRMVLVLANTFLFSLTMGIFISSISKYPRKSIAATFVLMAVFCIGLPLAQAWSTYIQNSPQLNEVFSLLDPSYSLAQVSDARYAASSKEFWWSVGVIHGMCWLFLITASVIVPRSWQDHPSGARIARWREIWHRWSYGDAAERRAFRTRLLEQNPFFWLAGRARLKPVHVWVGFVIIGCVWAWGAMEFRGDWFNLPAYLITALVINTMLKIWITSEAGWRLGEDRKMGALELLLSTPLGLNDILRGQMMALRRQFLGPLIVALVLESIFLVASLRVDGGDAEGLTALVSFWVAGMVMLVADAIALSAVAMWVALTTRNPNRTTGITLRRVLVLPVAIGIATLILLAMFRQEDGGWKLILGLWFGLAMLADAFFGGRAWWRLKNEFREAAVHRVVARPSLLKRLFGANGTKESAQAPAVLPVAKGAAEIKN